MSTYMVDEQDEVILLPEVPRPDVGAPLPTVLSREGHLWLAYLLSEPDPAWDGSYVTVVSPQSEGLPIALIRFFWPYTHFFGPPNDEAFDGHPLAARGLQPYSVFEIKHSSWLRRLERMNAVHRRHDPGRFLAARRHYIFAFHDSTFECIAEGFEVYHFQGSMSAAIRQMAEHLVTS